MQAGTYNLLIDKKATFRIDFTIYSDYNTTTNTGTPIDLTGCTVASSIKVNPNATSSILSFTAAVTDGPNGVIELSLTSSQTASIGWASGVYDVLITFPSGDVEKYIQGNVVVGKTSS